MNHSAPICPTCHQPTIHTAVGDICVTCEKVYPHPVEQPHRPVARLSINTPGLNPEPRRHETTYSDTNSLEPSQQAQGHQTILASGYASSTTPQAAQQALNRNSDMKSIIKRLMVPELPGSLDDPELEAPSQVLIAAQHRSMPSATPSQIWPGKLHAYTEAEQIAELDSCIQKEQMPPTRPIAAKQIPPETYAKLVQPPLEQRVADALTEEHATPQALAPIEEKRSRILQMVIYSLIAACLIGLWLTIQSVNSGPIKTPAPSDASQNVSKEPSAEVISRDAQRKKDLKDIATALEVYRQSQGAYPIGNDISAVYALQYASPPYISYVNYDPLSTSDKKVRYYYTSNGTSFILKAKLENSKDQDAPTGSYIVQK